MSAGAEQPNLRPISEMGYEEARDELIEVVRVLEQGGLDLDSSLRLWERGEELAQRCEKQLAGARRRVEDALARNDEAKD
ncbi:exodeoxyribonuclease VII small subunit [Mycobacterium sp.]|uniref:exodeoxyribonuclease VII small subunit n=1 Tax=Mycobacterium sp. TaxID=1785 RepID=UPI002C660246|nr:exodeoxyribonuclease VII small subunit [Mycobacterium sp.]HME48385.1 exodeoxyribonuclease VII small subunit [Mycobacterium sp.]